VVSSVRNDWKLSAIPPAALLLELEELELELDDEAGADVGIVGMVASTAMIYLLKA
jgi:hypothetical protein